MGKIIVTVEPSVENAVKALNEKADGFITQPFDSQKLLDTVRKLVDEKRNEYLQMLMEVENAKKDNPILEYHTPRPMIAFEHFVDLFLIQPTRFLQVIEEGQFGSDYLPLKLTFVIIDLS